MTNNFNILNDVPYGTHERQKVDIFIPEQVKSDSGIILFIHGGGWRSGDKTIHTVDAEHFCNLGYVCATMNYRYVSDDVNVFDELDDITSALKTIKAECLKYGISAEKMILSGGSAGGQLCLFYAYTRKEEAPVTPVVACVYCPAADCAHPDFLSGIKSEFDEWKYDLLSKCCGFRVTKETLLNDDCQKALKNISPDNYVSADCVPTVIFHGKSDELIPIEHIYNFIGLLNEYKVTNELLVFENSDHSLKNDPDKKAQSREIIKAYAERYF